MVAPDQAPRTVTVRSNLRRSAHRLVLKERMPLMLLRNLSPPDGLCNGTRLILLEVINGRLLRCEIATGKHRGDEVFIPRITLDADEDAFPFSWSRRQFPVHATTRAPCDLSSYVLRARLATTHHL